VGSVAESLVRRAPCAVVTVKLPPAVGAGSHWVRPGDQATV